jgi:transposase
MEPTSEEIENRTSDYVCWPCGKPFQKEGECGVVTAHTGHCGICMEYTSVTHIRAFNYLLKPTKQ